jgi:hypothetical protein
VTALLRWSASLDGIKLWVENRSSVTPSEWALLTLRSGSGQPVRVDPIYCALDDGSAHEREDGTIFIPSETLVRFSVQDGIGLGLPPRLDWPMVVRLASTVDDPESVAEFFFEGRGGRPLLVEKRTGALATIDGKILRFPPAVFQAIRAIDAYNETQGANAPERVLAWGLVAETLPEDVRAGPYLKEIRACEVGAFTLQPFLNEQGEADFDPIPGVWVAFPGEEGEPGEAFEVRIPDGPVARFQEAFRKTGPRARSALGGGWYLSLGEDLLPVLRVLHEIQVAEPSARLEFLRNPEAVLRASLPEVPDNFLSQVFASEDYSQRVQGTVIWKPPVLPWIRKEPERWLPEERLGVRIGEDFVAVAPENLGWLIKALEVARSSGRPSLDYEGKAIPATDESIAALSHLMGLARPEPKTGTRDALEQDDPVRVVLEVADNFESVAFTQDGQPRRSGVPSAHPSELGLRTVPLPHQVDALTWLQTHWLTGSSGALLADDMGLGKTFQALAFMSWVRREMDALRIRLRPFLVVAPTGLLENWIEEHDRHLSGDGLGEVLKAFGSELGTLKRSRGVEYEVGVPLLDVQRLRHASWILTTYETYRDYQHSFGKVRFAVAVLDETHKAKNPASGISQAMKTIYAEFILCVTGTPVENRLADLWNILDVARPGALGSLKEFSNRFEMPELEVGPLEILKEHLTDTNPSIMLRRMKLDHLEGLPPKEEHFVELSMPLLQSRAYSQILDEARAGELSGQGGMLAILGRLRSTSLHPFAQSVESDDEYIQASARLAVTFRILDQLRTNQEKALIFLESREMQGTLASLIQRRYRSALRPLIINGSVSGPQRQDRVRQFQLQEGFDVLILSPKAGGVGLTLTSANHVIHLSRWWNPAVEDQCSDRVYRIGQQRPVHIYHPLATHPEVGEGSFDLVLNRLLKRKRELSRAVMVPSEFSKQELQNLFDSVLRDTVDGQAFDPVMTDSMSPVEFENWVLEQFRKAGFVVKQTPQSNDAGVDGIAEPSIGGLGPTLLIQVKQTQVGAACPPDGVIELAMGHQRYTMAGPRQLILVTNALGFTKRARDLAEEHGVRLVARAQLGQIEKSYQIKR